MVCFSVKDDCYNLYESYGEICVHCQCCSKDLKVRYKSRLDMWQRMLQDSKYYAKFDTEDYQIENRKANEKTFKRRIRYYKKKLKEIADEEV